MTWQCRAKAEKRNYSNIEEKKNFMAGYSDGYHNYPMWSGSEINYYPNAYSAGYHEGYHDGN